MNGVPWLQHAIPYRSAEIKRLKLVGHAGLRLQAGSSALDVPSGLQRIGCCAVLVVAENKRKLLTVTVTVVNSATGSMTEDGFTITPRGKITPLYPDYCDD